MKLIQISGAIFTIWGIAEAASQHFAPETEENPCNL